MCFGSFLSLHRYFHLYLSTYVLLDVNFYAFHLIYNLDYSVNVSLRQDKYIFVFLSFPRYRLFSSNVLLCFKISAHQRNKDKPRSIKCRHFCFAIDSHNYCPTCKKSGKVDDPCVTFESPCEICASFTEEQLIKITHRNAMSKSKRKTLLVLKMMNSTF